MRKLFRFIGILLGSLVLLVVIAVVALPLLVDANEFKPRIETAVEDATGREFVIEGELSLSVFPWLGVEIGEARLMQPAGFGDKPFAGIDSVQVGVRLLPLLQKKLDVDTVKVMGPVIRLQRNAEGVANWEGLAQESETPAPGDETSGGGELPDIRVAGFELTDGHVEFVDEQSGMEVIAADLSLKTGAIALPVDSPISASADIEVRQGGEATASTTLSLDARLHADLEAQAFALENVDLSADVVAAALPESRNASLPIRLRWERAAAELKPGTASIEAATLELHEFAATFNADVASLNTAPEVAGSINIPEFDLSALLGKLGIALPEMRAGDALDSFTLDAAFAATPESARFTKLDATLDSTRLQGSAGLADLEKQAVRFDLAIDSLDVDRYLAPVPEEPKENKDEDAGVDLDAITLPVEPLRNLDVDGAARIASLRAMNLSMSNVQATVKAVDGKLRLNPFSADFYDGGYRGDIRLRVEGDALHLDAEQDIERFEIGPMLNDLAEIDRVSGSVSMKLVTRARGSTAGDWARGLGGTFKADARNGAVEGFNLWAKIREARAALRKEPFDASEYPNRTEFADLAAEGRLVKGEIVNDSLVAKLPFLGVQGSGRIQPLAKTMDYTLDVTVLDKPELAASMDDLRGTTIPVSVSGNIASPKVRPDVAGVLKARAKQEAEEALEGEKEDLKKKLEDKLKDIF